jgi:hypothetical protein
MASAWPTCKKQCPPNLLEKGIAMPIRNYKQFHNIAMEGNDFYIGATERCLNKIVALNEGIRFLPELNGCGYRVAIRQQDGGGNSCAPQSADVSPPFLQAVERRDDVLFQNELKAAIGKAQRNGITLEHLARQLAEGLTPATYNAQQNVVRPPSRIKAPVGSTGQQIMALHAHKTMVAMGTLQDLMDGRLGLALLAQLRPGWDYDLARLLRNFLTPGRGGASVVQFDPADSKPCAIDPAMKNRPPALGLVHEMIHAWHNATGRSMRLAMAGREKLEEVITTGLPPYNFEKYSDNKFRALWTATFVELRARY